MAIPGFGYRTVSTLLMEISKHLVEPIIQTTTTQPVSSPGSHTITVGSLLDPDSNDLAAYIGAQVVIDTGANAEVVTLTGFVQSPASITAVFTKTHFASVPFTAPTFPTQQLTDPIYTQAEMIGYVARAQNEFLEQVPVAMQLFYQMALTGQTLQTLPATAIELNHVSFSQVGMPIASLVRSGSVVTATFNDPHGLKVNDTFWVIKPGDLTFQGLFQVYTVPSPTTLTYLQYAADATTTGGTVAQWSRLYEATQQELSMANRQWRQTPGTPNSFFEDRQGNYGWGLGPIPAVGGPLELLASVRDSDTLTLLDGFLIADQILYIVKYLCLSFIFSKDGTYADPQRAQYCSERYKRGVAAVQRWMDSMGLSTQGDAG